MKVAGRKKKGKADRMFLLRLGLLAVCFLSGVILGQVLSERVPSQTTQELTEYLTEFFSLSQKGSTSPSAFFSSLVLYFRYPVLAFLLGFASVGVLLLPVLTVAYGFFLSFSVCCFTVAFGGNGVLLALAVFGIRCLVTLPCYFLLAVPALGNSASLAVLSFGRGQRAKPVSYGKIYFLRFGLSALALLIGVFTELFLSTWFLQLVLQRIIP